MCDQDRQQVSSPGHWLFLTTTYKGPADGGEATEVAAVATRQRPGSQATRARHPAACSRGPDPYVRQGRRLLLLFSLLLPCILV
jgi:hypothetical protein